MFSCEFNEIFQKDFLIEHLQGLILFLLLHTTYTTSMKTSNFFSLRDRGLINSSEKIWKVLFLWQHTIYFGKKEFYAFSKFPTIITQNLLTETACRVYQIDLASFRPAGTYSFKVFNGNNRNLSKVNNKDNKTASLTSLWCPYR